MSKGKTLTEQAIVIMDNLLKKSDAELIADFESHEPQGFGELLLQGVVINKGNTYLEHLQQVEKEIGDNPDMLKEIAKDYEPSESAKEFAQLERYIMSQDNKTRDEFVTNMLHNFEQSDMFYSWPEVEEMCAKAWDASRAESDAELEIKSTECHLCDKQATKIERYTSFCEPCEIAWQSPKQKAAYELDEAIKKDARIAELTVKGESLCNELGAELIKSHDLKARIAELELKIVELRAEILELEYE